MSALTVRVNPLGFRAMSLEEGVIQHNVVVSGAGRTRRIPHQRDGLAGPVDML